MAETPITPTEYSILYNSVLAKIKDFDLAKLSQYEVYAILYEHLRPAIAKFKCAKQDLKDRDDYTQKFNIELTDDEIEILSDLMLISYIDANYVRVPMMMKANLHSKDFAASQKSSSLSVLLEMQKVYKRDVEILMTQYSFLDSELFKEEDSGGDS